MGAQPVAGGKRRGASDRGQRRRQHADAIQSRCRIAPMQAKAAADEGLRRSREFVSTHWAGVG